jgi:hypothetical protein
MRDSIDDTYRSPQVRDAVGHEFHLPSLRTDALSAFPFAFDEGRTPYEIDTRQWDGLSTSHSMSRKVRQDVDGGASSWDVCRNSMRRSETRAAICTTPHDGRTTVGGLSNPTGVNVLRSFQGPPPLPHPPSLT